MPTTYAYSYAEQLKRLTAARANLASALTELAQCVHYEFERGAETKEYQELYHTVAEATDAVASFTQAVAALRPL